MDTTVTSTVAIATTAPMSCTTVSLVMFSSPAALHLPLVVAEGRLGGLLVSVRGLFDLLREVLLVALVVLVERPRDDAVADHEEPRHPLDVVAGGEPALRVVQAVVGGVHVAPGAVDVDDGEGGLLAVLLGHLDEAGPGPVGALVERAPEGEHVDALFGELEAAPFGVPRGEGLGGRGPL